jgi:hypothetical protein
LLQQNQENGISIDRSSLRKNNYSKRKYKT